MQPENGISTPNQSPAPIGQPDGGLPQPPQPAPISPAPTPVQTTPVQTPPVTPPVNPASSSSSHTGLIVGLAVVVVLIIAGLLAGWFLLWSPQAQAKRLSNSFMKAITTGNIDKAVAVSGDPSNRDFLTQSAPKVQGSYHMTESTYQAGKGYYLYGLSGAQNNYVRTIIAKEDGKLQVTSFVYDTQQLRLIPSASQTTQPTSNATASKSAATTPPAQTLACLSNSDYRWFELDNQLPSVTFSTTFNPADYTDNATDEMFFKPNSTQEESLSSVYDQWANFANHNTDKQWKFRLEGSTYGPDAGTSAAQQLANERANEVKTQLVNRGVPASRIIIDAPHNYSTEVQDDSSSEIYRRVQVVIDPTCTAPATTPSSTDSGR